MRHALAVMLVAGMAGGAAWYKFDPAQQPPVSKVRIPDLGLDEDELAGSSPPAWQPPEIELLEPVEKLPSKLIAEQEPQIHTISDEQAFASSEEEAEASEPPRRSPAVRTETKADPFAEADRLPEAPPGDTTAEQGQSVEGRPIQVRKLGRGKYRTVIFSGLDGRDRTAVKWVDELTATLESRPELLDQHEFIIIRAANPDGLAAKTRENARGVDLNRNFPTRRFRPNPAAATGRGPASEPETRALIDTLYDVRPQRVVHLCSSSGRSLLVANGTADPAADRLQRQHALQFERMNFDRLPGSLEELADSTWNSEVLLLQLRGVPEAEIGRSIVPVLLSAVTQRAGATRAGITAPVSTPRREPNRWHNGPTSSPVPTVQMSPQPNRQRAIQRRGYEELPPPPQ